jgi:RimJ/RimL family protein N-acetyltransferase
MPLRPVAPTSVPAGSEGLIPADAPTRPRALAVLDGVLSGRAWIDDASEPHAIVVIEDSDGTVYAGGEVSPAEVRRALVGVETASGDLIFGFAAPDDAVRDVVPGEPYWRGEAIDFTDRRPLHGEDDRLGARLPDGAELVRLDRATIPMTEWYPDTLHAFGSVERWEEVGIGYAVMVEGAVAAESVAGPRSRGLLEIGVTTREPFRRRGFGTHVSLAVARACEERGDRVWWNANAGNASSIAIARRLNFVHERRYELVACRAPIGAA